MNPSARPRLEIPGATIGAVLLFLGLWLLDFPKPYGDDIFYSGAAINMAQGGDFSNPYIVRQGFPGHYFFVYPPLHSYALLAWLKIFGISSAALTGFQIVSCIVISAATISLLRSHRAPTWLEWCVPLGVTAAFLDLGLRPETLATAMVMLGAVILNRAGDKLRWGTDLGGFLFLFLGASAAPRLLPFTAVLAAYAAYRFWRLGRSLTPAVAALSVAALLFFAMIGFRLTEFWSTFHFHAAGRVGGSKLKLLWFYVTHSLGILQMPLLLLPAGLIAISCFKTRTQLGTLALVVTAGLPLAVCMGAIGPATNTFWWLILITILLAASLSGTFGKFARTGFAALFVAVLLVVNRRDIVEIGGLISGSINTKEIGQMKEAATLRSTPENPVLFDYMVVRYTFDYRIPKGHLDFLFGAPFPLLTAADIEPKKGDIYLVSPRALRFLESRTHLAPRETQQWIPFGFEPLAREKFPRQVFIVKAEDCDKLR